jgi:hypothetical protein
VLSIGNSFWENARVLAKEAVDKLTDWVSKSKWINNPQNGNSVIAHGNTFGRPH